MDPLRPEGDETAGAAQPAGLRAASGRSPVDLPEGVFFDPSSETGAGEPEAATDLYVREVSRANQLIQSASRDVQKLGCFDRSQERLGESASIARI